MVGIDRTGRLLASREKLATLLRVASESDAVEFDILKTRRDDRGCNWSAQVRIGSTGPGFQKALEALQAAYALASDDDASPAGRQPSTPDSGQSVTRRG
jgi:hypothetical protein